MSQPQPNPTQQEVLATPGPVGRAQEMEDEDWLASDPDEGLPSFVPYYGAVPAGTDLEAIIWDEDLVRSSRATLVDHEARKARRVAFDLNRAQKLKLAVQIGDYLEAKPEDKARVKAKGRASPNKVPGYDEALTLADQMEGLMGRSLGPFEAPTYAACLAGLDDSDLSTDESSEVDADLVTPAASLSTERRALLRGRPSPDSSPREPPHRKVKTQRPKRQLKAPPPIKIEPAAVEPRTEGPSSGKSMDELRREIARLPKGEKFSLQTPRSPPSCLPVGTERGLYPIYRTKQGNAIMANHEARNLRCTFEHYQVPRLGDVGFIGAHGLGVPGWHAYTETGLNRVKLPSFLVDAMGEFWAHRDYSEEAFLTSKEVCAALIRRIAFDNSADSHTAKLWGPVVGYSYAAKSRAQCSAVLHGRAWSIKAKRALLAGVLGSVLAGIPVAAAAPVAVVPAVALGAAAAACVGAAVTVGIFWAMAKGALALARPVLDLPSIHGALAKTREVTRPRDGAVKVRVKHMDRSDRHTQREAYCTGFGLKGYEPVVLATNAWNESVALDVRGMQAGPPVSRELLDGLCAWAKTFADDLYGPPAKVYVPLAPRAYDLFVRQCIAECNSSTVLKDAMYQVHSEMMSEGTSCYSVFTPTALKKINETKMMVKRETNTKGNNVLDGAEPDLEEGEVDVKPRQIMCSSPANTVLTMPAIKRLQGILRDRWHEGNWLVYGPGCDVNKLASIINDRQPASADNSDFTNYDACRAGELLELFLWFCHRHGLPSGTIDIIRASATTTGQSRWGWAFEFHELLGSGRAWTTLFNTWLNNTMRAFVYCAHACKTPAEASSCVTIVGAGDDGLTMFQHDEHVDWAGPLAELGFEFESKHVYEFRDYEFCSMRLFTTSLGLEWLDCPGKVLAKLGWSVRAQNPLQAREIARGAALSFLPRVSGNPPLQAVLESIELQTRGEKVLKPRSEPWLPRKINGGEPNAATWADFYAVYGYTQDMHVLVQRWAASAEIGREHDMPILQMLCDVDTGGLNRWVDSHTMWSGEVSGFIKFSDEPEPEAEAEFPLLPDDSMGLDPDSWEAAYSLTEEVHEPVAHSGFSYDGPEVQVLASTPNGGTRVVSLPLGTCVAGLADEVGLGPVLHCMRVTVDGRETSLGYELKDDDSVTFTPLLRGGVNPVAVMRAVRALRGAQRGRSSSRARSVSVSRKTRRKRRASTPRPRGRRTAPGNRRQDKGTVGQEVTGSSGTMVAPSLSVPAARTQRVGRKGGEGRAFCDSGEDFWQNIPAGTYTAGQVILTSPLITSQMGSWLKTLLQLYEKWRITSLAMRYVPSVATTQAGNVVMFFDPDPTNNWGSYTAGPDLIKRAFTLAGRVDFSLWQATTARSPPSQWLWTQAQGSDPRLYQAGSFVVLCVTGFTAANDFGALHMDWSVEAVNKSYNQAAFSMTVATAVVMTPGPPTNPFYIAGQSMSPMAGGGGQYDPDMTCSLALGVPLAYVPNAQAASTNMVDILGGNHMLSVPTGPIMAFPAGEYLVNTGIVGNTTLSPAVYSLTPCAGPGVTINSQDVSSGRSNGGGVANVLSSTCLIEVLDDADSSAVPVDISNALTVTDSSPVNRVVPETNDWGFFDTLLGIGSGAVGIVDFFFDAVEVVSSIVGAFLVTSRHTSPNVHAHLMRRHQVRTVRYNSSQGLGVTAQERLLLEEFRRFKVSRLGPDYEPNRPVPVPQGVLSGKEERKEPLSRLSGKEERKEPLSPDLVYVSHGDDIVHVSRRGIDPTKLLKQRMDLQAALDRLSQQDQA